MNRSRADMGKESFLGCQFPVRSRSTNFVRKIFILVGVFFWANSFAEEWSIHWEAAKGDLTATIPAEPQLLSHYLLSIPKGHFESNADINEGCFPSRFVVDKVGVFRGSEILSVELEVENLYYSRYHLILAEIEKARYLPIYVNQYSDGNKSHSTPVFRDNGMDFSVEITVTVLGASPSSKTYTITSDLVDEPRIEQST